MLPIRFTLGLRPLSCGRLLFNGRQPKLTQIPFFQRSLKTSTPPKRWFPLSNRVTGASIFIFGVGAYGYYSYLKTAKKSSESKAIDAGDDITSIPDIKATRQIRNASDHSKLKLTLYQYQSCPFCCKVRAYLDFKGLSYDVVEVNSFSQKEIQWSKYKKVPILVCEAEGEKFQLNDSSVIVSCLETYLAVPGSSIKDLLSYYPSHEIEDSRGKKTLEFPNKYFIMYGEKVIAPADTQAVRKWREWTDKVLVHTISPNIYRTPLESFNTFKYFSKAGEWDEIFSWFDRNLIILVGSCAMFFIGKMLKRRHNLSDDVRQSLYNACTEWQNHVASVGSTFSGGVEPNLADLSVYGVLCAMEGTEAFKDSMQHTKISYWFQAMKNEVASRSGKKIGPEDYCPPNVNVEIKL